MLLRKLLKKISLFLVICIFNMISPLPVIAAEVGDVVEKLTPKQKEEIKNLPPEKKDKIIDLLGKGPPLETPKEAPSKIEEPEKKTEAVETEKKDVDVKEGEVKEGEVAKKELSKIEQGFLSQTRGRVGGGLRQFGYDIFKKAVDSTFPLIPSIPIGPDYKINAGDKLLVTLWGNVNESFELIVSDLGTVTIPKIGVVSLADYSLENARDVLYARLTQVFIVDFNIDLTIKEIGPIKVYLLGEFRKPGAYTILANTSLYDVIFVGGGPTRSGTLRRIELVRDGVKIRGVDLYDFVLTGKRVGDVLLKSGDVIRIPAVGPVVAIAGNVRRPGIYELMGTGKTELRDFIYLAGGITPTTYLKRIQIERRVNNRIVTAVDIDLAGYLKTREENPVYLGNLDYISVFTIEPTVRNVVYLRGNVTRPGRYELKPGMRLKDLFIKAQGLAPEAYMERAQIYRFEPPDMHTRIIAVNLNKLKMGDPEHNPLLHEFDRIRVYSLAEIEGEPMVYISGELNDGDGSYPLTDGMRISDLTFQAGGVKDSAYLKRAELVRSAPDGQIEFFSLSLNRILKDKDKDEDVLLQKNDYLFVRRIPDYGINETAQVKGNVKYPGKYAIYKGERLSSLIERTGGYTEKAFLEGTIFVRESIKKKQNEARKRIVKELKARRNLELARIPIGLPSEEARFWEKQVNADYEFAKKKLEMDIPGRIIINMKELSPGSNEDLLLQAGDILTIPDKVNGVTIMGEVPFPGTILYEPGKSFSYYVDACGGGTERADMENLLVLHASGMVEKKAKILAMIPGDTILIPPKPIEMTRYQEPFDWVEFWDITLKATLAMTQIVTSLVTVYLLYKSINQDSN